VDTVKNLAIYLSLGLGIPIILGIMYCCWLKKWRESKRAKQEQKGQFAAGLQKLQSKYARYLDRNDERLMESLVTSNSKPKSKGGFLSSLRS
jgi:hypothetical protein